MARTVKRLVDLVIAFLALVCMSPIMVVVATGIALTMGFPVIFRQVRPGFGERPFRLFKFRTMGEACDLNGVPLPDAARLTKLGRLVRKTSLDELPQLWNVLKGDMSLVGPRPLLVKYLPFYTEVERRRFSVKPGITGWAQVHGRNLSSWDERLAQDVWYVDHWSVCLDFRILGMTLLKVVRAEGVSTNPQRLMPDLDSERSGCRVS